MPYIQAVNEEWLSQELVVMTIHVGESPGHVATFLRNHNYSFRVLLDTQRQLSQIYNVQFISTSFFIDDNGIIRDIKYGPFASQDEIEFRLGRISPDVIDRTKEE